MSKRCARVLSCCARSPRKQRSTRSEAAKSGPERTLQSDAELDAYIRSAPATAHHPCGTCRMGSDEDAVVDGELRLRGVAALRVADASVMPDLVGGNINAAVIMIAEKAADLIAGRATPCAVQAEPTTTLTK